MNLNCIMSPYVYTFGGNFRCKSKSSGTKLEYYHICCELPNEMQYNLLRMDKKQLTQITHVESFPTYLLKLMKAN